MLALHCSASSSSDTGGAASGGGGAGAKGSGGKGANGGGGLGTGADSGFNIPDGESPDYSVDAFFAEDPPPPDCSDSGAVPVKPGGTPQCPDDKNLQGCPCPKEGETAACWPGKRKNRNKGLCKDGTTTCSQSAEFKLVWGECVGYQGISPPTFEPPPGATGKAACTCFSGGYWDVKNTSPCFYTSGSTVLGGVSTILEAAGPRCPTQQEMDFASGTPPAQPFSPNTLKVDCNGYFKLCFTLHALPAKGATKNPASDCKVTTVCSEAHYDQAGKGPNGTDGVMNMPDLKSWITKTPAETACASLFYNNGGYGTFSVTGTSDECDQVDKTFLTFDYCPIYCNDPAYKSKPECVSCQNGSGGPF
jgi:hypothetical protein